jgi:DNA-binding FadR family transcriptional regulator
VGHRRIAAAVARGDPRAARAAMRAHLADSQADLARSWDRPAPGPSVPDGDPAQP